MPLEGSGHCQKEATVCARLGLGGFLLFFFPLLLTIWGLNFPGQNQTAWILPVARFRRRRRRRRLSPEQV